MESRFPNLSQHLDIAFGLFLAIFAAILAINDLGGGKYGGDELQLTNEKTSAYLWYQAKGIKESLVEGQRDLLSTLLSAGAIREEKAADLKDLEEKLSSKLSRYKKEKQEILLGSSTVGKENWVQDVDGRMGAVVGAKELENRLGELGLAGDRFDLASLFLQICLVMGAIGILFKKEKGKVAFLAIMIVLGIVGSCYSVLAYIQAGAFS